MEFFFLIMTGFAFLGFIFGLAGKSRSVKKNSRKKRIFSKVNGSFFNFNDSLCYNLQFT